MGILAASEYTEPEGNVKVRLAWDVEDEIEAPLIALFDASDTPTVGEADGTLTRHDEAVQIDIYAEDEAQVKNLKYIVDALIEANMDNPGGVDANIFSTLFPGQWLNNDALSQAEGLRRRTQIVTLYRHRSKQ